MAVNATIVAVGASRLATPHTHHWLIYPCAQQTRNRIHRHRPLRLGRDLRTRFCHPCHLPYVLFCTYTSASRLPTAYGGLTIPIASPTTTPPERSKAKAMDLLRKHYGLSVTPPTPSGRPTDPLDLGQSSLRNILLREISDLPAFDSKAYYGQLITTASLTTLLKKENELLTGELFGDHVAYSRLYMPSCAEMRQLDSGSQALVYNHHHEPHRRH